MDAADKMHKHSIAVGTTLDYSKYHKWLQLYKKYLSCIELLKMRLDRLKKKYPSYNIKISLPTFREESFIGSHAKMMLRVLDRLIIREKDRGFYTIKLFAITVHKHSLEGYHVLEPNVVLNRHPKEIFIALDRVTELSQVIRERCLRSSLFYLKSHSQRILKTQLALSSIRKIYQKTYNLKSYAFSKLYQCAIDPVQLLTVWARNLSRLLKFDQIVRPPNVRQSISEELLELRIVNQQYKLRLNNLTLEFQRYHEQRYIYTNKKAEGLQELAEYLRYKDQLIEYLEAEIDILKGNATTNTEHSMRSNSVELVQLQLQSRRLESYLKKIMDREQRISENLERTEERNRDLLNNLDKAQQRISYLQYYCSQHVEIKKRWDAFAEQLYEKEKRLQLREIKCEEIYRLLTRVLISSREIAKYISIYHVAYLTRQIEDFQYGRNEPMFQPKTIVDALKLVNDIIESNKPIEYKHFLCFDSLCYNFDQIQQSVIRLKMGRTRSPKYSINGDMSEQPSLDGSQSRHNHSNPQLTSKLIQLYLYKKQCYYLVMAYKQKQLIVRQLLLEFIKHLSIKNMTKEAMYTFNILDEMFEFPESEKERMFQEEQTKKGFFGLFGRN